VNNQKEKTPMPLLDPKERIHGFQEVAQGYDAVMAQNEAARCLQCKNPACVAGCPVNVHIPDFIRLITEGDYAGAYTKIRETNALPAVCGRVCPQESQCESKCVRGIKGEAVAIGRLERFAADQMRGKEPRVSLAPANGKRIAVVGSGPAGLTCAGDLAVLGYEVTLFEALHTPGGVLVYGIPEFRLPKALVRHEIEGVSAMGVEILTNYVMGKTETLDELLEEGYDAIFVGSGAGLPNFMGIPGENLNGVYSANEFLTRINLMHAYEFPHFDTPIAVGRHVAVIGGGNVAMDAARSALRLGAETVSIVYRRSMDELPARKEEVLHAQEEGIIFRVLTNPKAIEGDENGWVKDLLCVEMELGEPDASGRRRPVEKADSEFTLPVDTVIMAIGNSPNPLIRSTTPGLEANPKGCIVADGDGRTSRPRIYAGGDAVTGAATVILAMGAGKRAAAAIHEDLSK